MKKIPFNKMLNLKGGVEQETYCRTVLDLFSNWDEWDDNQRSAAIYAYRKNCM